MYFPGIILGTSIKKIFELQAETGKIISQILVPDLKRMGHFPIKACAKRYPETFCPLEFPNREKKAKPTLKNHNYEQNSIGRNRIFSWYRPHSF